MKESSFSHSIRSPLLKHCALLLLVVFISVFPRLAPSATDMSDAGKNTAGSRRVTSARQSSSSSSNDSGLGMSSGRSIFRSDRNRESNRSSNRERTSEDRNRTRERASNQPGAKGATPAPKKTEKTVKGKKPPAKKPSGGGQSRGATTVEFKMRASPTVNILSVETTDLASSMHTVAEVGQVVVTRIVFRNGQQTKFDALEFALRYDPRILQVEGIDDSSISPFLSEPAAAKVDAARGILVYRAKFAEPRKDDLLVITKIQWKTLAPAEHTSVEFLNSPPYLSRVLNGDIDLLKPQTDGTDEEEVVVNEEADTSTRRGLLGADIAVAPTAALLEKMRDEETALTGVALARQISEGTAAGGVTLAIVPRTRTVKAGEEFFVDVNYDNPNRVEVDSVKVTVAFDRTVLEVVDYDDNGWITKGINAYDGAYHEDLPFDFHIRNAAHNALGQLTYHMGFSTRTRIPPGGTLFTIKFRAVAATPATKIGFEFDDTKKSPPTSVSFLGFNLIGSPENRTSALQEATVSIQPPK